ncbi:hypothetical protein AB0O91_29765 [Kitasatospora sp. NPDC089797]|uniref:hypothetical protein n=1 Tax=Kitasatospora sp. NPDC089797 TaxID=3155298 RepID=UPI00342B7046
MRASAPGRAHGITAGYDLSDDSYVLELNRVTDGRTLLAAIIPDEDPAREPVISVNPGLQPTEIPYEVMRWFLQQVEEEIDTVRAWMLLRPELVTLIHELIQEYRGAVDDAGFPAVLARVRAAVPAADVTTVIQAAFSGRTPADFGVPDQGSAP